MTSTLHHDAEIAPELAELGLEDKPDGPGAAAMIAAGVGVFTLGLFTVLAEVSEGIHDFLEWFAFSVPVGPLAGKSILAVLAFGLSWLILHLRWRNANPDIRRMFWIGCTLGIVGALLTFPPIFTAFA